MGAANSALPSLASRSVGAEDGTTEPKDGTTGIACRMSDGKDPAWTGPSEPQIDFPVSSKPDRRTLDDVTVAEPLGKSTALDFLPTTKHGARAGKVFARPSEAITGLRFIAAMSVALAHGVHLLVPYVDANGRTFGQHITALSLFTTEISAIGMSVFFVLSGFVIHYNYFDRLKAPSWRQTHNFIVARFARLYPLYILVLLLEFIIGRFAMHLTGDQLSTGYSIHALPYFLTMTQSWIWTDFYGLSLVYQFGPITPLSWSISTEWFFYLMYPLIALSFAKLQGLQRTILLAAAFVLAGYMLVAIATSPGFLTAINAFALRSGGPVADISNSQDSIYRWIFYFSPYTRILEFIAGCLTAHVYMLSRDSQHALYSLKWSNLIAFSAVGILLLLHVMIMLPDMFGLPTWVQRTHMNFGYALGTMLLIYCLASSPSWPERFLSSRLLVIGGGMSYSIYLLHMGLWSELSRAPFGPNIFALWIHVLRLAAAFGILFFVSYAVYRHFEQPARVAIRRTLQVSSRGAARFSWRYIPVFVIIAAPFATIAAGELWPISGPNRIWDVAASYGRSCGVPFFLQSRAVAQVCRNKAACEFTVDVHKLGDPANGCAKNFLVIWRCSRDPSVRHVEELRAEAGLGSIAHLSCLSKP
jgi:peptidoglycan/LPS O-acetylase OafA/YrhL